MMVSFFYCLSSGALLFALAYNARLVKADFLEDIDNCKLELEKLHADVASDFCHDWTYGRCRARGLKERAAWCVDRPCRLVQYDDDTIVEACKNYLGYGETLQLVAEEVLVLKTFNNLVKTVGAANMDILRPARSVLTLASRLSLPEDFIE